MKKAVGPVTKAIEPETMPQVIMMRAIQSRAPTLSRTRLLGTSNSTVADEEQAGADAVDRGVISPRSLFMVSAAKPMFTRST